MDEASLARLGEVGDETTLRHAQLMTPAAVIAQQSGREISIADLEECQIVF